MTDEITEIVERHLGRFIVNKDGLINELSEYFSKEIEQLKTQLEISQLEKEIYYCQISIAEKVLVPKEPYQKISNARKRIEELKKKIA